MTHKIQRTEIHYLGRLNATTSKPGYKNGWIRSNLFQFGYPRPPVLALAEKKDKEQKNKEEGEVEEEEVGEEEEEKLVIRV